MIKGYRVYEKDGHVYVDLSRNMTPLQEAFYNAGESLKIYAKIYKSVLKVGGANND